MKMSNEYLFIFELGKLIDGVKQVYKNKQINISETWPIFRDWLYSKVMKGEIILRSHSRQTLWRISKDLVEEIYLFFDGGSEDFVILWVYDRINNGVMVIPDEFVPFEKKLVS